MSYYETTTKGNGKIIQHSPSGRPPHSQVVNRAVGQEVWRRRPQAVRHKSRGPTDARASFTGPMPHGDTRRRHASQVKALPCKKVEADRPEHLLARQPDEAVRGRFIGTNTNAVKWQIWTGLLVHLLLHYLKYLSSWKKPFSRLVGLVKCARWVDCNIVESLKLYGTAGPPARPQPCYRQQYLAGFGHGGVDFMG